MILLTTLLASAGLASAAALDSRATMQQDCQGTSFEEAGNWYCRPVGQVVYQNLGTAGQYQQVTGMDAATGACTYAATNYSGPLAPFDEPLSVHFRGPIALKQFAWYVPSTVAKRDEGAGHRGHRHPRRSRHSHQRHLHEQRKKREKRENEKQEEKRDQPTVWVTVTMDGQVVSWINNYSGPPSSTDAPAAPASATTAPATVAAQATSSVQAESAASSLPTASSAPSGAALAGFVRAGYYNASAQDVEGLMFLGNYGGQGSGEWTRAFGNTLSYVNANGTGGASSPQILADTVVPSGSEFAITTNESCDASCGYVLDGSVAYKGFAGASKIFLFEFSMPHSSDATTGANADMPAIWLLNARVPYTGEYGPCNCWATGCGELDVFEVLTPGDAKCKSTVHAGPERTGGDSDYFARPDGSTTAKVAVVFDAAAGSASVTVLDAATEFGAALTALQVRDFVQAAPGLATSEFQMGGASS